MDCKEIRKRVKELRVNSKISKKVLSEYLKISKLDLEDIENGKSNSINSDIVERLSDLYLCSTDYILGGKDSIKSKVDFKYSKANSNELVSMARVFKIIKNQIEMDAMISFN